MGRGRPVSGDRRDGFSQALISAPARSPRRRRYRARQFPATMFALCPRGVGGALRGRTQGRPAAQGGSASHRPTRAVNPRAGIA
jgi:hypothetical protein